VVAPEWIKLVRPADGVGEVAVPEGAGAVQAELADRAGVDVERHGRARQAITCPRPLGGCRAPQATSSVCVTVTRSADDAVSCI
jgi:hypothetical protein